MGPLYRALHATKRANKSTVQIHPKSPQHRAMMDLRTIFKLIGSKPIRCKQLIPGTPHYFGYTDACKHGAGGIWLSGTASLHPIVWRYKWPPEVVQQYEQGLITINDLEMAGLLLHYLLLEQLVPMKDTHTAAWTNHSATTLTPPPPTTTHTHTHTHTTTTHTTHTTTTSPTNAIYYYPFTLGNA